MIFKKRESKSSEKDILEKKVAIDIGLSSVKFAYFKENLLHLDEFPLSEPPKDISGIKQEGILEFQATAIKKAVSMINPSAEFILSPQPSFLSLARVFPRPTEIDIRRFLDKELPFEPDQFAYDIYRFNGASKEKRSKKSSKIALFATDIDFVQGSIGLLGEHQLQVKKFTPGLAGLMNYLLMASNTIGQEPIVCLDLGAFYSHLVIIHGREQILGRTFGIGGNHFNQELSKKLNIDFETAEKIKKERKLIDDRLFDSKGGATSMPMYQAINAVLFGIVDEIKHSMTYFEDSFLSDLSKANILLAGGSSKLQNLDKFLERELDIPVKYAESAIHNLAPQSEFEPQFASSIGLLVNPSNKSLMDINLLKNIEGMQIKLDEGDYFLTKEGFVNKKTYKKKQKSIPIKPGSPKKKDTDMEDEAPSPLSFILSIPDRIMALIKGEELEAVAPRKISFSFPEMSAMKELIKPVIIIAGILFLVIYGGDQFFWSSKEKKLNRSINNYLLKSNETDKARGALMAKMGGAEMGVEKTSIKVTRADKIIWADKLKAVSGAVPEKVWVSDLTIKGSPPALVMSCHVYSYGEDHLKDIALFIQNLKSQKECMKDFRDIIFRSAVRNKSDKDVYDFTLTLPLKRNIIEMKKETL